MLILIKFFPLFLIFHTINCDQTARFRVVREWKYINFTWPNEETYRTAVDNKLYIPENNLIAGIKYFEDYYYLTLPKMKNGVPVTLARIQAGSTKDTAPHLEPFPSWEMNNMKDCNSLHNVQNIEIDPNGQVWIIDGGRVNTLLPQAEAICQPKLVIFDIKNNITTLTYTFPEDVASKGGSFLYDIVLDDSDGGYAYITDNSGSDPGIIVYSMKDNRSWKIRHSQTMKADPMAINFMVNDVRISAPINIAGIALGPKVYSNQQNTVVSEDREVFFSPLSSLHLFAINSSVLRNSQYGQGEYQGDVRDVGLKTSQTVGMAMDNNAVLYFGLLAKNTIAKWDTRTPFQSGQIPIGHDDKYIVWPNSFTFDQAGNLAAISNSLNRFIYENINLDEPNFRIMQAHVGAASYLYDKNSYNTEDGGSSSSSGPNHENNMHDHQGHSSSTEGASTHSAGNNMVYSFCSLVICLVTFLL